MARGRARRLGNLQLPVRRPRRSAALIGYRLAAGLGSSLWTALVGLAVIPFYVRYLGIEGYGVIGFMVTALAALQVLDFGIAATVNREVARGTAAGDLVPARSLTHTAALFYWCVAVLIAAAVALFSPFIAEHWLRANTLSAEKLAAVVALMGVVIACRWPSQLYQGALMGAERIGLSSLLSAALVTLGGGGAVLVLAFASTSLEAFLLWQAGVALAYTLAARAAAWRVLRHEGARFDSSQLVRVWRFSAGLAVITVAGLALTQADKIILSKMLPLAQFGEYMLAVTLAAILYLVSGAFYNVLYPRFSILVHSQDSARLAETYRLSARLLGAIVFPAAMLLSVHAEAIVRVWTGDAALAAGVASLLPWLAAGTALHCMMHVPYALMLAHGLSRLPLALALMLAAAVVPLTIWLTWLHGARGGAEAWFILHCACLLLGTWMTHRRILKGIGARWLAFDVGLPLAAAAAAGSLALAARAAGILNLYAQLAFGAVCALAAFALVVALSPGLRVAALVHLQPALRR